MEYLLVGVGGIFGSLCRYVVGRYFAGRTNSFPIGTFLINISGAALLGFVSTIPQIGELRYLVAVGFLGAFTTFSTFMNEGFHLIKGKKVCLAAIYILVSILIGTAGYTVGTLLALR